MKKVTHILYPVSYVDDAGKQRDTLWSFDPSELKEGYWVGEPIEVVVDHPAEMGEEYRTAKILKLREELAALEAGDA
jgi:hypothetical protein